MSHNTCEWYLNNFVLKGGNNTSTRHIVISPGESTIFYKYKENGSPAYKVDRIFGRKDKLSKNDFTAPPKEDRSKCNSVPNFLKRFFIIIRKLTQLVGCLSLTAVAPAPLYWASSSQHLPVSMPMFCWSCTNTNRK